MLCTVLQIQTWMGTSRAQDFLPKISGVVPKAAKSPTSEECAGRRAGWGRRLGPPRARQSRALNCGNRGRGLGCKASVLPYI